MILLCCAAAAFAQSDRGTIHGRVLDQGQAVGDAPVEARSVLTGSIYRASSSASGEYALEELPPGDYDVSIAVEGFEKAKVTVRAAQVSTADFQFQQDFQLGTLGDGDVYSRISQYRRPPPPQGATPRDASGKPDLAGVWRAPKTIRSDEPELLPEARKALDRRFTGNNADSPAARCMPDAVLRLSPFFKILLTPSVMMVVIEAETPGYYQVFLDGRGHPAELLPTWYGHAIGRWEGDTLVVDTAGFNDRRWLTQYGTPISARLHLTERIQRLDLGHLQIETTVDDPGVYPRPWSMTQVAELAPSEEIMESICNENNKDPEHMVSK